MADMIGNALTYLLWFISFIVIFNLLKKKPWPRFWRWLLSGVLGYLMALVLMFLFALLA